MSSSLPLVRQSRRVLPLLNFSGMRGVGHKLEINIPPQQILCKK